MATRGLVAGIAACVMLTVSGCPEETPSNRTSIPIGSLEQQLINTYCTLLFQCSGQDDVSFLRLLFSSPADCIANVDAIIEESLTGDLVAAVDAGNATYDEAAAAACVNGLTATDICTGSGEIGQLCPDVFEGTVSGGGACTSNVECGNGLYCEREFGTCPGACATKKSPGQSCDRDAECAFTGTKGFARCQVFTNVCVNIDNSAPPAGPGTECGFTGTSPNLSQVTCTDGNYCKIGQGSATGTCATFIAVDQPCGFGDACVAGALCIETAEGNFCKTVTVASTEGAECGGALATPTFCDPLERLVCSSEESGTCLKIGDGTAGSQCSTALPENINCNSGLYCSNQSGVCTVVKADGEACDDDEACSSGVCDAQDLVCRAPNACGE